MEGIIGLYSLVAVSFFMSLMFPTIYGIALEGLTEEQSKIGSAGLIMAIVGGALMPKLQGMLIDAGGPGVNDIKIMGVSEVNFSFVLPFYALYILHGLGTWCLAQKKNLSRLSKIEEYFKQGSTKISKFIIKSKK